jgi:hypothetical protein
VVLFLTATAPLCNATFFGRERHGKRSLIYSYVSSLSI